MLKLSTIYSKIKTIIFDKAVRPLQRLYPAQHNITDMSDTIEMLRKIKLIIDTIEIDGDKVLVKLSKDIIIENSGNTVTINKGMCVTIAGEIHFNPNLPLAPIVTDYSENYESELTQLFHSSK